MLLNAFPEADEGELAQRLNHLVRRLERLSSASPERSVAIDWLEWIAEMPTEGLDDGR